MFTFAGLAAALGACLCVHWASAHQRWLAAPWPGRPARIAGAALVGLAWACLAADMQRLTATFVLATELMLVLAVLPYVGAWLELRRGR